MKTKNHIIQSLVALFLLSPLAAFAAPDLTVKDIRLVKGCKIQVIIANIGTTGVPSSYYNLPKAVGVQMYKGSQAWGGLILSGVDPSKRLMNPGTAVKHIWFPLATNLNLSPGVHTIKVTVDNNKVLAESNERNNTLVRRVRCGSSGPRKLPDLTVTKIFAVPANNRCRVGASVKNIGNAPVPDYVWTRKYPRSSSIYLWRNGGRWGGQTIWKFDPRRKLQPVGGTATYLSNLYFSGTISIRAKIDHTNQVRELSERNNVKSQRLRCASPVPEIPGRRPGTVRP